MFKKSLPLVIAGLVVLGSVGSVKAQYLDLSHIAQANMNFDQQFNQWAWQGSVDTARWLRMTGTPNPFSPVTAAQSARGAWDGYNAQWHVNSARTSQAVGNWTNGAVRGMGPYYDPNTGATYNLPWTPNQYHINQYNQAVPSYNANRTNLYPYYGR